MTWLQQYRVRRFLETSFWIGPVGALLAALVTVPSIRWFDHQLGWRWLDFTPDGARALSPAVNDPTTAVMAIDQIHRLLRWVGSRQLDSGMIHDSAGRLRLIVPAPTWEDYVCLAVSEIRLFGAGSIQVPRRLRAMLEHLIEVLPAPRAPALRQELALLHSAVEREYAEAEDRHRAETGDRQGVGGSTLQDR